MLQEYLMTLATIGFFVLSGTANATTVVNLNSSATLFFDDYEGLGTNVSHTNMVDTSGDYDPVATTGTWSIYEADAGGYACQVTDSTAGSAPVADPGAYQGNNYLRFDENPDLSVPEVQFAEQTTIGDTIHFESMMYLAYGVGAPAIIAKERQCSRKIPSPCKFERKWQDPSIQRFWICRSFRQLYSNDLAEVGNRL